MIDIFTQRSDSGTISHSNGPAQKLLVVLYLFCQNKKTIIKTLFKRQSVSFNWVHRVSSVPRCRRGWRRSAGRCREGADTRTARQLEVKECCDLGKPRWTTVRGLELAKVWRGSPSCLYTRPGQWREWKSSAPKTDISLLSSFGGTHQGIID